MSCRFFVFSIYDLTYSGSFVLVILLGFLFKPSSLISFLLRLCLPPLFLVLLFLCFHSSLVLFHLLSRSSSTSLRRARGMKIGVLLLCRTILDVYRFYTIIFHWILRRVLGGSDRSVVEVKALLSSMQPALRWTSRLCFVRRR